MKKCLAFCTAVFLMLNLCGCAAEGGSEETTTAPNQIPETTLPAVTEATMPEISSDGELFLTVSQINFSLVGESEQIYIGTVLPEAITWISEDESVATFQDGVLTATGVGTTTVRAQAGDREVSCTVGCLAATQEELEALDEEILRAPKRLPPVLENPPVEFFDDAAIIGDSISYILFQYETQLGHMGHPLFLARGGTSLNGLVRYYKNVFYQGQEMKIEDAVAKSGVKKIFVMLGQNDLGYRTIEDSLSSWDLLLGRILEQSPDVEVYIQSCVHEWKELYESNEKNEKINAYNEELIRYAQEHGYHYVDIQQYVVDHTGRMATIYSMDYSIHLNETGCIAWMQALNAYAYQQMIGGTNS